MECFLHNFPEKSDFFFSFSLDFELKFSYWIFWELTIGHLIERCEETAMWSKESPFEDATPTNVMFMLFIVKNDWYIWWNILFGDRNSYFQNKYQMMGW